MRKPPPPVVVEMVYALGGAVCVPTQERWSWRWGRETPYCRKQKIVLLSLWLAGHPKPNESSPMIWDRGVSQLTRRLGQRWNLVVAVYLWLGLFGAATKWFMMSSTPTDYFRLKLGRFSSHNPKVMDGSG